MLYCRAIICMEIHPTCEAYKILLFSQQDVLNYAATCVGHEIIHALDKRTLCKSALSYRRLSQIIEKSKAFFGLILEVIGTRCRDK